MRSQSQRWSRGTGATLALVILASAGCQPSLRSLADQQDRIIADKTLPFWFDQSFVKRRFGYTLGYDATQSDDVAGVGPAPERGYNAVSQARLMWVFSEAHRRGYSTPERDYLEAARFGFDCARTLTRDPVHGGYFLVVDDAGTPPDDRKLVYVQAFMLYATVAYYQVSQDPRALEAAKQEYQTLSRFRDTRFGGWIDLLNADFTTVSDDSPELTGLACAGGWKTSNSQLHVMEALTAMYRVWPDPAVRADLIEALRVNRDWFYKRDPRQAVQTVARNGTAILEPPHTDWSYGHNVEFAWLMADAQRALGGPVDRARFDAYLALAAEAYDPKLPGLPFGGIASDPTRDGHIEWWVQNELLAALAVGRSLGLAHADDRWLDLHARGFFASVEPSTGLPYTTRDREGKVTDPRLSHGWNAGYHDLRAKWVFIDQMRSEDAPPR